jgi:hypothetical protein
MQIRNKVLFTILAGAFVYLLTNVTRQPPVWQLTMSIFVGGIVLVVQILIETAEESRRTARIVVQMDEVAALFTRTDEELGRSIAQFVRTATRIDGTEGLRLRFANLQIRRMTTLFDGLERGSVEYEGEDRDWLLGLTETAMETIDAISTASFRKGRTFVDEEDLWTSDLGMRYLTGQRKAVDRGVKIRRLFLLDEDPEAGSEANLEMTVRLLEPHKKIGIETRVIRSSNLDFLVQANLADFVLFDDKISYELEPAPSMGSVRPVIARSMLVVDGDRVHERRGRFESLWANGEKI